MAKKFVQAANVPRPLFIAELLVLLNGLIHIVIKMGPTGNTPIILRKRLFHYAPKPS